MTAGRPRAGVGGRIRRHPLLALGFVLALGAALFFLARTVILAAYWMDPAHHAQPVEPWMTPGYIAHSWHVPPEIVARAMAPDGKLPRHMTVEEVARSRGEDPAAVIARIEAAIAQSGKAR